MIKNYQHELNRLFISQGLSVKKLLEVPLIRIKIGTSYLDQWRKNNPEKIKAHRKVYVEVRAGRLKAKPCEICGKRKTEAHHDDYSKPLSVRWLCKKHHEEHHTKTDL